MRYDDWKREFLRDKVKVNIPYSEDDTLVRSIERFQDGNQVFWETGITYTKRVVLRRAILASDGITLSWTAWETLHHIVLGD